MLDLPIGYDQPHHIRDFDLRPQNRRIVTCHHCYGGRSRMILRRQYHLGLNKA